MLSHITEQTTTTTTTKKSHCIRQTEKERKKKRPRRHTSDGQLYCRNKVDRCMTVNSLIDIFLLLLLRQFTSKQKIDSRLLLLSKQELHILIKFNRKKRKVE